MFILFPVLFVLTTASSPRTNKQYRTDYVYNWKSDAFYKLHIESVWNSRAKSVCKDEGAQLMVPTSDHDIVQLHAMIKGFPDIGDYVWVGVDGLAHESAEEQPIINCKYSEHQYQPYLATFRFKYPITQVEDPRDTSASMRSDCNVVTRQGDTQTFHCYRHLPFICKVDAKNIHYDPQCHVYVNGYKYYASIGSCYKISRIASSWGEAYDGCRAEGSHLVVLNSAAEQQIIYNITNSAPPVDIARTSWFFFVGVRAQKTTDDTPRVFKTIFNQTLEQAGFDEWSPGEPNNAFGDEYCGSIFKNDGKFNDVTCSHSYVFVCEKEIQTVDV